MNEGTQLVGETAATSATAARFEQLQNKLALLWKEIGRSDPGGPLQGENTIVVIPSLPEVDFPSAILQAYEERFLFMLFLLRQPRIRIIYVTSQPIEKAIVDYYLDTLPGVVISNARKRLSLVSVSDSTTASLSSKLLARPHALAEIRALVPDLDRAHLVPFLTTASERELAVRLGIPMYGADPNYADFGTKSGGRRIFAEEGVPYPFGRENLYSEEALVQAICQLRALKPEMEKLIVKLNEGVSGMGNAMIDLLPLPPPGVPQEEAAVAHALRTMQFELTSTGYDAYVASVRRDGAIVEELITGSVVRSPSAQLRISPLGEVEMLSTHDQILGGPTGQSYLGARFPADAGYAGQIMQQATKIGRRLAQEGVIGRFAVDFIVVQSADGAWRPYAIEINLRKGGTTAPYLTLQYLTDGRYDEAAGTFFTSRGDEKFYVASDHVESPSYRLFSPDSLLDIISYHRLQFDHTSQTGLVLHMFSGVGSSGQLGVTAISDSHAEADALYQRFVAVLDQEAQVRHTG